MFFRHKAINNLKKKKKNVLHNITLYKVRHGVVYHTPQYT